MNSFTFSFNEDSFNKIFPFYILVNEHLEITLFGNSLAKLYPSLKRGEKFQDFFSIKRPYTEVVTAETLRENLNQLVIFKSFNNASLVMRGQFEAMGGCFLFVGSPWFVTIEEVKNNNLNIFDFANYDSLLDLLQIVKTQEMTTLELKEQLTINDEQKEELKRDREELNRLSLVASANRNAIVFTHPDAKIFWCNDAYLSMTGYRREEVIGKTPIEVGLTSTTSHVTIKEMTSLFYSGQPFDIEIAHGKKDGTTMWARTTGQPVLDKNGKVVQYFAMIEDMTIAKQNEEQMFLLSLIAEKNINAIIICDKKGKIEWVNSSFTQMSGYSSEELIGKMPEMVLRGPDTDEATILDFYEQIQKGESYNCELLHYTKTGKEYWVKVQGQALYSKSGKVTRYFALEEDITEKKLLENQKEVLLQSLEKSNHELEDYAQIVSHDLKSPLRSINSLIAWIKEENEGKLTEDAMLYFSMIENKLEKMDDLIQGILTYSKIDKTDIAKENVNLNEVVGNIINIIHIPDHIKVAIKEKLPIIKADRFRMQQLFQNLISNAVNYIDKPEGFVEIGMQKQEKHYVFYVKDNGPGIDKKNHEKIFKMFQSLTNHEKSTGIGLSIVKKIIDTYKGQIWIESEPGKGTIFYIQLPL